MSYLEKKKTQCKARIDEIDKELDEIKEKVDQSEDEDEQKALGKRIDDLQGEKDELEAEMKEIDDAIAEEEKKADDEPKEDEPKPEDSPARKSFLQFNPNIQARGGKTNMNLEERTAKAEEFKKTNALHIEKPNLRAVTIASGQIAIPTEVHGIENPEFVPYSSILDFVKVEDMTGAGYNKISLLTEWSEADEYNEGEEVDEDNPAFGMVTIQPEKGFKTFSTISNEVLKTSPLNYYGKVEESAGVALRKLVATTIIKNTVGAKMDDNSTALNRLYSLPAIDENALLNISLELGGEEGVYGASTLVLNKKDLRALGQIVSSVTKQHVYKIRPNEANPNIGTIENDGLVCRYILTNQLPAMSDESTEAGTTCMLYGDLKSVEVDMFGAYDIKVSEDYQFQNDLLAIRGTAMIGVGVTRLYGLVEVQKPSGD